MDFEGRSHFFRTKFGPIEVGHFPDKWIRSLSFRTKIRDLVADRKAENGLIFGNDFYRNFQGSFAAVVTLTMLLIVVDVLLGKGV